MVDGRGGGWEVAVSPKTDFSFVLVSSVLLDFSGGMKTAVVHEVAVESASLATLSAECVQYPTNATTN